MKSINIGTLLTDGTKTYKIEKHIGTGGFADVYKAKAEGLDYAIKVIREDTDKNIASLKNEYDIASKVESDHAIKYYFFNEYGQYDFPCYIIMEYADGGSLQEEYSNRQLANNPYTNSELFDVYSQLVEGMIDISRVAVHRDIKLQNILISKGKYKISDYGLAKYEGADTRTPSVTMKGAGTKLYYAPEVCEDPMAHGINNVKVDIYAMGIVFYQLANLSYPYEILSDFRIMHMCSVIKPFNKGINSACQSLIRQMMEKSPAKRIDSWEIIKKFIADSSVGKMEEQDEFVDSLLKSTIVKKSCIDEKNAKEKKEKYDKEIAFRRLASQIETEIYCPLKELVDSYNNDSIDHKLHLSNFDINIEEETIEFEYKKDALSEEEYERTIRFYFEAKYPEENENYRPMPLIPIEDNYNPFVLRTNQPSVLEYKFKNDRILLWGEIEADCGEGISVGIIENKDDTLYGKLTTFIRRPNITNTVIWLPIDSIKLKDYCKNGFNELRYMIDVKPFTFESIKALIKMNEVFDVDSICDPYIGTGFTIL